MAGIGILSGILLVATYIGTLPAIERNKAAALELSARLLRFTFRRHDNGYRRRRIDEAADILNSEFARPLTIAEIARRVGLNECYLKRYFRRNRRRTPAPPAAGTRARPHRIRQHRPSRHALLRLPPRGTVQRSVQAALRIFAFGCEEVLMGPEA